MNDPGPQSRSPCLEPVEFRLRSYAIWLLLSAAYSVALSWVAVLAERKFAPWLVFPFVLGFMTGGGAVVLLRFLQVGHRPMLWVGLMVCGLIFIGYEHHFHFRIRQGEMTARWNADHAAREKAAAAFPNLAETRLARPPSDLGKFLRMEMRGGRKLFGKTTVYGWKVAATWAVDGLIVLMGVVTVARPFLARPYCRCCRSWYRTTRAGQAQQTQLEALAALVQIVIPSPSGPGHYRLRNCRSGCGPTQLTLAWHGSRAGALSIRPDRVVRWLDADARLPIAELLDEWHVPKA